MKEGKGERWAQPKHERECMPFILAGPGCVNYGLFMQWNGKQLPVKEHSSSTGHGTTSKFCVSGKKKTKLHNRV